MLVILVIIGMWLMSCVKILREYERAVIFRLGRVLPEPKGPGIIFIFVPFDRSERVDLRTITLAVPSQDIITRDNVSVKVNAVVYYRVMEPRLFQQSQALVLVQP